MATRIQLRRGISTDWSTANPVLSYGEIGIEIDTKRFRIGDGSTAWNSLSYFQDTDTLLGDVSPSFDTLEKIEAALLPVGGTSGQFLMKDSGTDYDVSWDTLTLGQVSDVNITSITNRDKLVYDSATSKWKNVAEPKVFVQSGTPSGAIAGDLWVY